MNAFCSLLAQLSRLPSEQAQQAALLGYCQSASRADQAWATWLLAGGKLPTLVPMADLQEAVLERAQIPVWLFEQCKATTGDGAEALALVLPSGQAGAPATQAHRQGLANVGELSAFVQGQILPLLALAPPERAAQILEVLAPLDAACRHFVIRLVGGRWRSPLRLALVHKAMGQHLQLEHTQVAQCMGSWLASGDWPCEASLERHFRLSPHDVAGLDLAGGLGHDHGAAPYTFMPVQGWPSLQDAQAAVNAWPGPWLVQRLLLGQRVQVVKRGGRLCAWSRARELLAPPEHRALEAAAALWPEGTVADGVLVATAKANRPRLVAFDLLQWQWQDLRGQPLRERLSALQRLWQRDQSEGHCAWSLLPHQHFQVAAGPSDLASLLQTARAAGGLGLVFKHEDAAYGGTQAQGGWWHLRAQPHRVGTTLFYGHLSQGAPRKRLQATQAGSLFAQFTVAVWNRAPVDAAEIHAVLHAMAQGRAPQPGELQLVPLAKLAPESAPQLWPAFAQWAGANLLRRFGPVHTVAPGLEVSLEFDAAQASARHKSGVLLHGARASQILAPNASAASLMGLGNLAELKALLPALPYDATVELAS